MIKDERIDLNPEFQRKGNLWPETMMSQLIESILLQIPIPAFYFDASEDNRWLVIDGLQRLWALTRFILHQDPPLVLKQLTLLTHLNGKTFDELEQNLQRRIERYRITTYLLKPGTPKIVRYEIFRRINASRLDLTPQEIRHALNQGKPATYLRKLSEDKRFKNIIPVDNKRMADRELILRYLAFSNQHYTEYQPSRAEFLDSAMEHLNTLTEARLEQLAQNLWNALELCQYLFGKHIFSKSILDDGEPELNGALFEVWTVLIGPLQDEEINRLRLNKNDLILSFKSCLQEDDFYRALSADTASREAVVTRFETIESLIKRYQV